MDKEEVIKQLNIDRDKFELLLSDPEYAKIVESIVNHCKTNELNLTKVIGYLESYKKSPYLKQSIGTIEYRGLINRHRVLAEEFGKKIDETHGTMFYFKEKARELAIIGGYDPDEMRMAFTEGIQNVLEHGKGEVVDVSITAVNNNTDGAYFQMSFKYYMESRDFYSLAEANRSADSGMLDFENPRGRGEFMMREIMDERKFINGLVKKDDGTVCYFFQRILRKYRSAHPKFTMKNLSEEFKHYIDTLEDYKSALFVRMDYFSRKKDLVFSEHKARIKEIQEIMMSNGYHLVGEDKYKGINFTFWESPISESDLSGSFDMILSQLRQIIYEGKS